MNIHFAPNTLYYGDCLNILRDFPSECVDLICLDPPFNSNANYHTIFRWLLEKSEEVKREVMELLARHIYFYIPFFGDRSY